MRFNTKAPLIEQIVELQDEIDCLDSKIDELELNLPEDFKVAFENLKASVAALEKTIAQPIESQPIIDRFASIDKRILEHDGQIVESNARLIALEKSPRLARLESLVRRLSEETLGVPETNTLWREFP